MLKFYFNSVPKFIKIPDSFRNNSGIILVGEKEEFVNSFENDINKYLLTENFLINYSVKVDDFDVMEKVLDFKGAFGQNKFINYNKSKFYSEKFYIKDKLYYYDISNYKDFFDENFNLFRSGFSGFCFFSNKLVSEKIKYIFPLDFVNNYYGNIYINFEEQFLDNNTNVKIVSESTIESKYLNGTGRILGIELYEEYLKMDRSQVIIVKDV